MKKNDNKLLKLRWLDKRLDNMIIKPQICGNDMNEKQPFFNLQWRTVINKVNDKVDIENEIFPENGNRSLERHRVWETTSKAEKDESK